MLFILSTNKQGKKLQETPFLKACFVIICQFVESLRRHIILLSRLMFEWETLEHQVAADLRVKFPLLTLF